MRAFGGFLIGDSLRAAKAKRNGLDGEHKLGNPHMGNATPHGSKGLSPWRHLKRKREHAASAATDAAAALPPPTPQGVLLTRGDLDEGAALRAACAARQTHLVEPRRLFTGIEAFEKRTQPWELMSIAVRGDLQQRLAFTTPLVVRLVHVTQLSSPPHDRVRTPAALSLRSFEHAFTSPGVFLSTHTHE